MIGLRGWIRAAVVGLAGFFLLEAVAAVAQTIPTSVTIMVLPAAGDPATVAPLNERTTVIGTVSVDGSIAPTAACGHPPAGSSPTTVVNGSIVEVTDPFDASKVCLAQLPRPLPDGAGYRIALVLAAPSCAPEGVVIAPCPSQRMLSTSVLDVRTIRPRPGLPARAVVLP
jgi:hypothetical protein